MLMHTQPANMLGFAVATWGLEELQVIQEGRQSRKMGDGREYLYTAAARGS